MTLTQHQEMLYNAVTEIDEKYIAEALSCKTHTVPLTVKRIAAVAATILLVLTLSYAWYAFYYGPEDITLVSDSPFIITAGANNGSNNIKIPQFLENMLSSYSPGYEPTSPYGDHILFFMKVKPAEWQGGSHIGANYTIEIRYNDTLVTVQTKKDEHIGIYFTEENDISVFSILGWFDEPTEMTITFIDDNTGIVVQEQVILVVYDSATQTYEFTVKELFANKKGAT